VNQVRGKKKSRRKRKLQKKELQTLRTQSSFGFTRLSRADQLEQTSPAATGEAIAH
jgi:hypothetical protein